MKNSMLNTRILSRNGLLYPLLLIAAISVILFSALGVATMMGLLPRAESTNDTRPAAQSGNQSDARPAPQTGNQNDTYPAPRTGNHFARTVDATCANCGVIESITPVEVKASGSGLGMVAGGLTGALVGNQIGRGSGNTLATIAGAAGGAFAGNEIEKNVKKTVRYQVKVRMHDGTFHTSYQSSAPAFAVGDKVKIVNGQVVAPG